jgi:hypothetical protein
MSEKGETPKPSSGEVHLLSPKLLCRILRAVREWESLELRDSYGQGKASTLTRSERKSILEVGHDTNKTGTSGGTVEADPEPFEVTLEDQGDGTSDATMYYGTVNGLLPSNISSAINVANDATRYVCINVTTSSGQVSAVTWSLETSAPAVAPVDQSTPPTSFSIAVAIIVDATVYRIWANQSNMWVRPIECFRTDKTGTINPGESPYDFWFSWQAIAS